MAYAYSDIKHADGVVKRGEKVDQKTIGASDEEWESYQNDNVVGEDPLPEEMADHESLADYKKREAAAEMARVESGDYSAKESDKAGKTEAKEIGSKSTS